MTNQVLRNDLSFSNIFNDPEKYINEILTSLKISRKVRRKYIRLLKSKSLTCVWLTRLCFAGCPGCFFYSTMDVDGNELTEEYQFSSEGLNHLINFINDANTGYLLLAGGGEPMMRSDLIENLVSSVNSSHIVIVTNGYFGKTYDSAKRILKSIYDKKKKNSKVTIRLSIDSFHIRSIGMETFKNIINVFHNEYRDCDDFILRIHTMQNDNVIENLANEINASMIYDDIEYGSDNPDILKLMPNQGKLLLKDGYQIKVGIAKVFHANLKKDLRNYKSSDIQRSIDIFEEDLYSSEYGNPSIVANGDGSIGFDIFINYNGNAMPWQGQILESISNIYRDNFSSYLYNVLSNPLTFYYIHKGSKQRDSIIEEVSPETIRKGKALNLRDYYSQIILEESKIKLYYLIRVIQNLISEGILSINDISGLSENVLKSIFSDKKTLKEMYNHSNYDIISQYIQRKETDKTEWDMLFILINLGHYKVSSKNIKKAIEYYNSTFNCNIQSIDEIKDDGSIPYNRFLKRIDHIPDDVKRLLRNPK